MSAPVVLTRAALKAALNERGALIRDVERTGLRRLVFASGGFLAVKYFKTRVVGVSSSKSSLRRTT